MDLHMAAWAGAADLELERSGAGADQREEPGEGEADRDRGVDQLSLGVVGAEAVHQVLAEAIAFAREHYCGVSQRLQAMVGFA